MTKKTKDVPFHVKHNYKEFQLGEPFNDGPKFWAKDRADAELYCKKIGWSPIGLFEIEEYKTRP
jgi:hypothetical protein